MSQPRRYPRLLAPVAVAAAVAVIAAGVGIAVIVSRSPGGAPVAGSTVSAAPTGATSASPPATAPSSSAARPADCVGTQMTVTIVAAGPVHDVENVVVVLRNTSQSPCWLGGLPLVSGELADGSTRSLPFNASTDPGFADPGPVQGPGVVPAGGWGGLHLTFNTRCTPTQHYTKLLIPLGGILAEIPYPKEFTLGCPLDEAIAGPIADPNNVLGN